MVVTPTPVENLLIVIGEGAWVLSAAAQLRQLMRTRNTRGLHAVTQTLNTAGNVGWCTYFALNHLWYPFVTNVMVLGLGVGIIGFILVDRKQFARGLLAIAVIGPITGYALVRNPALGGWVGMAYNWLAGTPQLVRITRRKKVSGLSERSLFFATSAMLCVLAYGLLIHALPLIAGSIQGLTYMTITMRYYYRYRRYNQG